MSIDRKERSRADRHNNPTALTVAVARQAGLVLGTDYEVGDPFPSPSKLYTARLLGDPIELTIRVIDKIGFRTSIGQPRWTYINMPLFVWEVLSREIKKRVIKEMYLNEGGSEMLHLWAS